YASGEMIFGEGDPCAGLFVVHAGNVRIFKSSANGREQVLSIDGPGSSIAELPVFDGGNYPASAQAVSDSTLPFFSRQDFQTLCLKLRQVALKGRAVTGGGLGGRFVITEELSFPTARHRLMRLLVRFGKGAKPGKADSALFPLP